MRRGRKTGKEISWGSTGWETGDQGQEKRDRMWKKWGKTDDIFEPRNEKWEGDDRGWEGGGR